MITKITKPLISLMWVESVYEKVVNLDGNSDRLNYIELPADTIK